ncbi:MAG: hypothetical protein AUG74_04435 [Bacteroidetes bacterium 13_1_20CM_4_60_6]|nr:MAG: hypothetical protein AUG74_04435 [Bacteroidetes bacterium 13_1_20CM_4_60_6]
MIDLSSPFRGTGGGLWQKKQPLFSGYLILCQTIWMFLFFGFSDFWILLVFLWIAWLIFLVFLLDLDSFGFSGIGYRPFLNTNMLNTFPNLKSIR